MRWLLLLLVLAVPVQALDWVGKLDLRWGVDWVEPGPGMETSMNQPNLGWNLSLRLREETRFRFDGSHTIQDATERPHRSVFTARWDERIDPHTQFALQGRFEGQKNLPNPASSYNQWGATVTWMQDALAARDRIRLQGRLEKREYPESPERTYIFWEEQLTLTRTLGLWGFTGRVQRELKNHPENPPVTSHYLEAGGQLRFRWQGFSNHVAYNWRTRQYPFALEKGYRRAQAQGGFNFQFASGLQSGFESRVVFYKTHNPRTSYNEILFRLDLGHRFADLRMSLRGERLVRYYDREWEKDYEDRSLTVDFSQPLPARAHLDLHGGIHIRHWLVSEESNLSTTARIRLRQRVGKVDGEASLTARWWGDPRGEGITMRDIRFRIGLSMEIP